MNLQTQIKVKSNINNIRYLKEQSHWYKYLNRNRSYYRNFEQEMKNKYRLTTKDKIDKLKESMDMVLNFMDILQ